MNSLKASSDFPYLGFGVGLRHRHFDNILAGDNREVTWVEALTENYLPWADGRFRRPIGTLEKIRRDFPMALHGVSMSIGSTDALDLGYLRRLKSLAERVSPAWISDHLCWTQVDGENLHDLLPLPYTEEAIRWTVEKIDQAQNFLGRTLVLENVSSYVEMKSEMPEWEFVASVAKRSGCGILLDINNIYVSARNHGFDSFDYLAAVPWDHVSQIHLAGHTDKGTHLIDTHNEPVCDAVWDLYRWAARNRAPVSTLIEWDDEIPDWPVLENEVVKAKKIFSGEDKYERRAPVAEGPAATL